MTIFPISLTIDHNYVGWSWVPIDIQRKNSSLWLERIRGHLGYEGNVLADMLSIENLSGVVETSICTQNLSLKNIRELWIDAHMALLSRSFSINQNHWVEGLVLVVYHSCAYQWRSSSGCKININSEEGSLCNRTNRKQVYI